MRRPAIPFVLVCAATLTLLPVVPAVAEDPIAATHSKIVEQERAIVESRGRALAVVERAVRRARISGDAGQRAYVAQLRSPTPLSAKLAFERLQRAERELAGIVDLGPQLDRDREIVARRARTSSRASRVAMNRLLNRLERLRGEVADAATALGRVRAALQVTAVGGGEGLSMLPTSIVPSIAP